MRIAILIHGCVYNVRRLAGRRGGRAGYIFTSTVKPISISCKEETVWNKGVRPLGLPGWLLTAIAWVVPSLALSQESAPYQTRNLSPLVSIFGLPAWRIAEQGTQLAVVSELGNHYRFSRQGPETLILDGETWRTSVFASRKFGSAWTLGAEIPYYRQSGGLLDDLIDAWHSAFSLPDGGRNRRPEGELAFRMEDAAGPFYRLNGTHSGLGDIQLSAARRLGPEDRFVVTGTLKLPTGKEGMLAGSGATDLAVTLLRPRDVSFRNRPAGYFWGVGVLVLGDADHIRYAQERTAYMAVVGGSMAFGQRFGLKAQIDMHSPLYKSQLEEIGEQAFQATVGGWWEFGQRGILEFGVNEDLEVSTSPDVVMHINASWRWQ